LEEKFDLLENNPGWNSMPEEFHKRKAVVLLSGGLDSSTTLALAKSQGYEIHALIFDYGQRHKKEVESARKIAEFFGVRCRIMRIDLKQFGGSALTDRRIRVPERRPLTSFSKEIPPTYVPARNTIFLGFALAWTEVIGAEAIFIGANAIDYSGYPDCRPEFYQAFQKVAELGTKRGVEGGKIQIKYPLITLSKAEIIRKGKELGVPFHLTWSCYKGEKKACGKCDSCILRLKGFKEAGLDEPLEYEED